MLGWEPRQHGLDYFSGVYMYMTQDCSNVASFPVLGPGNEASSNGNQLSFSVQTTTTTEKMHVVHFCLYHTEVIRFSVY